MEGKKQANNLQNKAITGSPAAQGGEQKKTPGGSKAKKIAAITAAVTCCLGVSAAGAYTYLSLPYRDTFFPNTVINGLDVSHKDVDQVKQMIDEGMKAYTLTLEEREGAKEQISGDEIGLHSEYDGSLERLLAGQQPLKWGLHWLEGEEHTIETMIAYDPELLNAVVNGLDCMDESKTELPTDAYLSEYREGVGYEIIPEAGGTRVVPKKVHESVANGIMNLKDRISLEEEGAYARALITAENPELLAEAEKWNKAVNVTVTYHFGDQTEVLNGDTIHTWMTENEEGGLELDEAKVAEYVAQLAVAYDTAYQPKQLKTTTGETVTITNGNYGWRINRKAEAAALSEIIRSGNSQEREPVYAQTAAARGENDYGNTYVEINLSAQHLYYYVDGQLLIESDFVSGNEARGMGTPGGAFPLTYKQRNAVLRGQGYASPVSYWMPFNGGIGMHDASWRGSFGGRIYKTNGSHGCINLPSSAARTIFENISSGIPVLCYYLDGSGSTKTTTTSASSRKTASAAPAAASAPAPAPETAPAAEEAVPVIDPNAATVADNGNAENLAGGENGGSPAVPAPEVAGPGGGSTAPVGPGETNSPVPESPASPVITGQEGDSAHGPGVGEQQPSPQPEQQPSPQPEQQPLPQPEQQPLPQPEQQPSPQPAAPELTGGANAAEAPGV